MSKVIVLINLVLDIPGTFFCIYANWCCSCEPRNFRCHTFSKQQARYVGCCMKFLPLSLLLTEMSLLVTGVFSHGFTYSGHPVSCAVAIEALKIYKCVPISLLNIQSKFMHRDFDFPGFKVDLGI